MAIAAQTQPTMRRLVEEDAPGQARLREGSALAEAAGQIVAGAFGSRMDQATLAAVSQLVTGLVSQAEQAPTPGGRSHLLPWSIIAVLLASMLVGFGFVLEDRVSKLEGYLDTQAQFLILSGEEQRTTNLAHDTMLRRIGASVGAPMNDIAPPVEVPPPPEMHMRRGRADSKN